MNPDVAASIKARLLTGARAGGEEFERTLTRFAAERLLYRLGASPARQRCLLKGASLLAVWLPDPYRATRDVDLLSFGPADDTVVTGDEYKCTKLSPGRSFSGSLSLATARRRVLQSPERVLPRFIAGAAEPHLDERRWPVSVDCGRQNLG